MQLINDFFLYKRVSLCCDVEWTSIERRELSYVFFLYCDVEQLVELEKRRTIFVLLHLLYEKLKL